MRKKLKRKPIAEINVVPYIDVMMVLLVIFMISTPLLTQGVKVDLPQAQTENLELDVADTLIAKVDRRGILYLTIGNNNEESVTRDSLLEQVKMHMQQNPKTTVLVAGDELAEYRLVMDLLALLSNADVPNVGLMTKPIEDIVNN
ncbi:MAG: protein TolR [Pseudomonadota bacterium]